jgi:hypothetical protein
MAIQALVVLTFLFRCLVLSAPDKNVMHDFAPVVGTSPKNWIEPVSEGNARVARVRN